MAILSAELLPEKFQILIDANYSVISIFTYKAYTVNRIVMVSVIVLMVCLIRIPSMSLAALCKEISFREFASTSQRSQLIMKWRRNYILIRDLVSAINAFVGRPIFLFILLTMISSINLIFVVVARIVSNDFSLMYEYMLEIVTNIICLSLLAFLSDQIPQQVSQPRSWLKVNTTLMALI